MKVVALAYKYWWQLAGGLILAIVVTIFFFAGRTEPIDSYEACVEAGYPVLESNPPVCRANNHNFTGTPLPIASPQEPTSSVLFELLVDGDTKAEQPVHGQQVITTQDQWQAYWAETHVGMSQSPPIIPVDFASSQVVVASLGIKPTGGYGLRVTSISASGRGTVVNLTETTPGQRCIVTDAQSNRYVIVRTPILTSPVNFNVNRAQRDCP